MIRTCEEGKDDASCRMVHAINVPVRKHINEIRSACRALLHKGSSENSSFLSFIRWVFLLFLLTSKLRVEAERMSSGEGEYNTFDLVRYSVTGCTVLAVKIYLVLLGFVRLYGTALENSGRASHRVQFRKRLRFWFLPYCHIQRII